MFSINITLAQNGVDSLVKILSEQIKYDNVNDELLLQIAEAHIEVDNAKARDYAMAVIEIAERKGDLLLKAKALLLLGTNQVEMSNYDSAIFFYNAALPLIDDKREKAKIINSRGIAFERKGNYILAFGDYLTVLQIFESLNDKKGIAKAYLNIGLIRMYKAEYKISTFYFRKALSIFTELNDEDGVASSVNNLGICEKEQGNYSAALIYFKKVLAIDEKGDNKSNIAGSLNNVGTALDMLNKHAEALEYYYQSVKLKRELKEYYGLSNTFLNIGASLIKSRQFNLAEAYLDSSAYLNKKYNFDPNNIELYESFYKLELARGNYAKALEYYQQYHLKKDSITHQENQLMVGKLQAVYDLEKANHELEISRQDLKWANYTRFVSIIVVVLLASICVYFYYNIKRTSKINKLLNRKQIDLQLAKDQAEYASKIKSQFLSVVSHEIRTPLNAIVGVSNLLQNDGNITQQENINVLQSSTQLLLRLINDLLDLHKLELGKVEVDIEQLDIVGISESLINMFKVTASQKNIELSYTIDKDIKHIFLGDDIKLTQALTNLISNAIKFTDKGYVELLVEQVSVSAQQSTLRFAVKDTGIGVNENEQQKIFESFEQASENTSRLYGGTGLGLSISKRLIEVMGGEIVLKSKPNVGSEFSFQLTLMQYAHQKEHTNAENIEEQLISGKRILIADDNSVNVFVIKQFLDKWGATIEVANNGQEALNLLADKKFDLILMDVQMPVKDGLETTIEIRKSDMEWKNIPIVALTASHEIEVKDDIIKSGMNDYVIKPFEPQDLVLKLSKQFSEIG